MEAETAQASAESKVPLEAAPLAEPGLDLLGRKGDFSLCSDCSEVFACHMQKAVFPPSCCCSRISSRTPITPQD